MIRLRLFVVTLLASSSPHTIWRRPVASSSSSSGCLGLVYRARSLTGTMPELRKRACVVSEGTWTMMGWPGLKPSLRFHSRGSMRLPLLFAGIAERWKATRRPVALERSAFVSAKSLGNGSRHPRLGTPLQLGAATAGAAASAIDASAVTTTTRTRMRVIRRAPSPGTDPKARRP